MSRQRRLLLVSVFTAAAAVVPSLVLAGDIFVPADYPKIQQAINNSVDGDVIHVSPGTYVENIRFRGKAVTLRSTDGASQTTIQAARQESVVLFDQDEGRDSVLDGFRVTGGRAQRGGGIYCDFSSPTIVRNEVVGNIGTWGGGISVIGGDPFVHSNEIADNRAEGGGGMDVQGSKSILLGNWFHDNAAFKTFGGGLSLSNRSDHLRVVSCVFENNDAGIGGGGAALYLYQTGSFEFLRCTFLDNESADGGALYFHGEDGRGRTVSDCEFRGNAALRGGAIYARTAHVPVRSHVIRSTFHENGVSGGTGAAIYLRKTHTLCRECIFWADTGPHEIAAYRCRLKMVNCDLDGGKDALLIHDGGRLVWGPGNFDSDPRFVDPANGDLRLLRGSPCVDAGPLADHVELFDRGGRSRHVNGLLRSTVRTDVGAHEFQHVDLEVHGKAKAGETLTIETTGTRGMAAMLIYGFPAEHAAPLPPYGTIEIDLGRAHGFVPLDPVPGSTAFQVPPGVTGLRLRMQALAFMPFNSAGALSNKVTRTFQ